MKERINALIEYAKQNEKVFVIGGWVYTPDEALDAMLDNYKKDMELNEWDEDECMQEYEKCMFDKQEEEANPFDEGYYNFNGFGYELQSFDMGLTAEQAIDKCKENGLQPKDDIEACKMLWIDWFDNKKEEIKEIALNEARKCFVGSDNREEWCNGWKAALKSLIDGFRSDLNNEDDKQN